MRWLWECLARGVEAGGPDPGGVARLRRAMTRVRMRAEYHRSQVTRAGRDFDEASRQVRYLEISEDAEVADLVAAHRSLLGARNALDHHRGRGRRAEEVLGMMRSDLSRMADGLPPTHGEVYAEELDR